MCVFTETATSTCRARLRRDRHTLLLTTLRLASLHACASSRRPPHPRVMRVFNETATCTHIKRSTTGAQTEHARASSRRPPRLPNRDDCPIVSHNVFPTLQHMLYVSENARRSTPELLSTLTQKYAAHVHTSPARLRALPVDWISKDEHRPMCLASRLAVWPQRVGNPSGWETRHVTDKRSTRLSSIN